MEIEEKITLIKAANYLIKQVSQNSVTNGQFDEKYSWSIRNARAELDNAVINLNNIMKGGKKNVQKERATSKCINSSTSRLSK
jgi:hypothetical protein